MIKNFRTQKHNIETIDGVNQKPNNQNLIEFERVSEGAREKAIGHFSLAGNVLILKRTLARV